MFGLNRPLPTPTHTAAWLAARGPITSEVVSRLREQQLSFLRFGNLTLFYRARPRESFSLENQPGAGLTVTLADPAMAGCSIGLDPARDTLTARCDPFGAYRLFTAEDGETRWCASDPRPLARALGQRAFDPAALHGYLSFSYLPSPESIFAGIRAVPAGGCWQAGPLGTATSEPAPWQERPPEPLSEQTAVTHLRRLLQEAVERRLRGTDRAGVFLSGGLDSSLVAALLVRAGVAVTAYTLNFGPPYNEEVAQARRVAVHLGISLRVVDAGPRAVRTALAPTAAALQQPFGDAVTVPLYLLGQAAARDVAVAFNGEGGDQLFGGWANKPMVAALAYAGPALDRERAYLDTFHRFHGYTAALYTARARAATTGIDTGAWIRPALQADGGRSLLHALRAANLCLKGAQNIAPRAVQLATVHGLRLEMPFFDQAMAEWSFALPPDLLLHGAREKHLLKLAAEPLLPEDIIAREKRGMGVPVTEWCLGPLRREAGHWLGAPALRRDRWFAPGAVAALRRGEDSEREFRRRRVGEKLWTLLMWQAWKTIHEVHPL